MDGKCQGNNQGVSSETTAIYLTNRSGNNRRIGPRRVPISNSGERQRSLWDEAFLKERILSGIVGDTRMQ